MYLDILKYLINYLYISYIFISCRVPKLNPKSTLNLSIYFRVRVNTKLSYYIIVCVRNCRRVVYEIVASSGSPRDKSC